MKDWTTLALQESKMLLESSLLDTKQLYISTGLGGKGESLRFFAAIINKTGTPFDSAQREIIEKEFDFQFRQQNGEIEEIEFNDKYAQIMSFTFRTQRRRCRKRSCQRVQYIRRIY